MHVSNRTKSLTVQRDQSPRTLIKLITLYLSFIANNRGLEILSSVTSDVHRQKCVAYLPSIASQTLPLTGLDSLLFPRDNAIVGPTGPDVTLVSTPCSSMSVLQSSALVSLYSAYDVISIDGFLLQILAHSLSLATTGSKFWPSMARSTITSNCELLVTKATSSRRTLTARSSSLWCVEYIRLMTTVNDILSVSEVRQGSLPFTRWDLFFCATRRVSRSSKDHSCP